MSRSNNPDGEPVATPSFSLYATEEAVLEKSEVMLSRLAEVAGGVQDLAHAYRRSYREQRRLVRISDRMQLDLHNAVQRLEEQARELQELNETLSAEIAHRVALEAELRRLVETDTLTDTLSRRRFLELAEAEWGRQAGSRLPACLLMVDLDRFKVINDAHGHAAGDRALVGFALACKAQLRPRDLIGRIGGEEFCIVLPETGVAEACRIAEDIRRVVAAIDLSSDRGRVSLSASIGLAQGCAGDTLEDAMTRADKALYRAKHSGRNRVQVFAPDRMGSAAA
ncbi:GGDEF domain-containing protein [Enterovirga sp. CN4-39]|uniref:GGDEF domain-containing protein n=1 Tax=Enterovirga sp. CN4-39 TaxID=3400910 RepID=UPI003BFE6F63